MKCIVCDKELSGGLDTFGDACLEMCWDCYSERAGELEPNESWYGLAPHHHDQSITGNVIGSTVFDPLPEPDPKTGEYRIDDVTGFVPDHESAQMGTYYRIVPPGWR